MADINELLDALKSNLGSNEEIIETSVLLETKSNIADKFKTDALDATIEQLAENITYNKKILDTARQLADQTGDPGYLESFASVSKANTENLKTLSMLISEREKIRSTEKIKEQDLIFKEKQLAQQKELKEKELALKREIAEGKKVEQPSIQQNNTINLMATRDQLFDALFSDNKDEKMKELLKENGLIRDAEIVESF